MKGNLEDLSLVDKILNGDESCFKELVEKHQDYVFTITSRILSHQEEAEEAAQDAFIKAFHALKRFNRQAKFTTWLYRIAFNTAITYKRKRKLDSASIDDEIIMNTIADPTKNQFETEEKKRLIDQALGNLLPADATVLTLFHLKEFSLEEIAEITGMTLSAVKVKLFRARKRLASELTRMLQGEIDIITN